MEKASLMCKKVNVAKIHKNGNTSALLGDVNTTAGSVVVVVLGKTPEI